MPEFVIRSFRRDDRDPLTRLVNAHIAAVIPGVSVSVNTVLSQLERRPAEVIIDPWVIERVTLVAEQAGAVVAAAHLLRYGAGREVSDDYRDAGVLEWFVAANFAARRLGRRVPDGRGAGGRPVALRPGRFLVATRRDRPRPRLSRP
ncbi:hypothetical protein [Nocardia amikacinitolerans]|uniref:hypothetical protein n=1 Tax=Nocardia amikacinitolerans TaxID=756689 RepID=UPI0020A3E831|nr:hypothetical protein [Nocardia amikacinitolerans]MCP2278573.1 hypothetical protein [Nocardia amikacinitolerans]